MAAFHLLQWLPDPRLHIFRGYSEVIESVAWGLEALGHQVTIAVNRFRDDATTIVFGSHLMPPLVLARLAPGSILYNLEQLPGLRATGRTLDVHALAGRHFTIWDYSTVNMDIWLELGARDVVHVPIGHAPGLERIERTGEQDIDVLIYGATTPARLAALGELCARGLSTMFFCGLYGAARDALIARSKTVLCLTGTDTSAIFAIVRASYLMANRKAVIGDLSVVERDIAQGVAITSRAGIADLCQHYVENAADRLDLEERGFAIITRRDIRGFLATALQPRDVPVATRLLAPA